MQTNELREKYLQFFALPIYAEVPTSVSLPSVLFTPAGINQFKNHFVEMPRQTPASATVYTWNAMVWYNYPWFAYSKEIMPNELILQSVEKKIITLRNEKVILDSSVAELYGVETKHVNQAVRNNPDKFPPGYIFDLSTQEKDEVVKILTTSKMGRKRGRWWKISITSFLPHLQKTKQPQ